MTRPKDQNEWQSQVQTEVSLLQTPFPLPPHKTTASSHLPIFPERPEHRKEREVGERVREGKAGEQAQAEQLGASRLRVQQTVQDEFRNIQMEEDGNLDKRAPRSQRIHTSGACREMGSWLWQRAQPECTPSKRPKTPKGNFCGESGCPLFGTNSLPNHVTFCST